MEKTPVDPEAEKLERLMKIIENMNLNSNGPNITKVELVQMRKDLKNKKKEDKNDKKYKREKLIQISKEDEIGAFSGKEITKQMEYSEIILSNPNVFNLIINFEFYYYECESVNDRGWGSGWRCFQSFLKTALNYVNKFNNNYNHDNNRLSKNENEKEYPQIKIENEKIEESFINSNSHSNDKYSKIKSFDFSFENLFLTYGDRDKLDQIFIKKRLAYITEQLNNKLNSNNEENENENINLNFNCENFKSEKQLLEKNILSDFLREKPYAPFETQFAWAEPFILDLISFDFNLKTKLYLLNGPLEEAFTPQQVFEKTISFPNFIELAFINFSKKRPLPIIIDDSTVSFCILGLKKAFDVENENKGFFRILIADPHVAKGKEAVSGVYTVDVSEAGKFLRENNRGVKMNGKRLRFDVMEFMVIVAEEIRGE